jgi:RNA polymerase sigma factor (sigma-70 family)
MEALRLLSSAAPAVPLPGLPAEHHHPLHDQAPAPGPLTHDFGSVSSETWDAALVQTHLADLLSGHGLATTTSVSGHSTATQDQADLASGLSQLDRYLSRSWYRAGIPAQMHEDCSQAVYATLLQHLGRDRFDALVAEVGHSGIRDVLSRETNEGLDFFRAVDMVKKRAQREKTHQSIDVVDLPAAQGSTRMRAWREALREAIDHSLSPREASLINETLRGRTPAEIASDLGVAPKTVSNEKARVIQKLRDLLQAHDWN